MRGFSLVELSIVLVILGLLTGGILTGQSLIRAAELRNLMQKSEQYRMTVFTFRDKYFSLPGDMKNATDFWGAQDGSTGYTSGCYTTAGTGTQTCNGTGDGFVDATVPHTSEALLAWEHLSNAGMVEGQYNGLGGGTSGTRAEHIPGVNSPVLIKGLTVVLASRGETAATQEFPISHSTYWLRIAVDGNAGGNTLPRSPAFTPEEQWNLDKKIDDGRPGFGSVRGTINSSTWAPGCSTTDVADTAEYALTSDETLCFFDMYAR